MTTELFQPKVLSYAKKNLGYDLIEKILDIFYNEDQNGNHWMLHILTKNHNIDRYTKQIAKMKHMVQVEFSIIHHDEIISRQYEKYTSSIKRRLDAIETLSQNGIFVRVMAMPFYGDLNDFSTLTGLVFSKGAQAFKNKLLNYYDWSSFDGTTLKDKLSRVTGKMNNNLAMFLIKSGGKMVRKSHVKVEMPKKRKRGEKFINWAIHPDLGLENTLVEPVDLGYRSISKINWKYIY
ncbi:MAG: hypothetical protein U5K00_00935 [Melioribacteraceae bacterium]|nr:hypothetical protein [Melioribacteraceae bacterium]